MERKIYINCDCVDCKYHDGDVSCTKDCIKISPAGYTLLGKCEDYDQMDYEDRIAKGLYER